MAERLPSLPLFVDDYEAATAHLTLEEDGAYMRLLRLCWRTPRCSVPDDADWIMRRMRVDQAGYTRIVEPIIAEFFKRSRGRIFQKRLLQEFEYVTDVKSKRKEAGKKGGIAKASKNKDKPSGKASDLLEQNGSENVAPYPTPPNPCSVGTDVPTGADAPADLDDGKPEPVEPLPAEPPAATAVDLTKAVFDAGLAILKPIAPSEKQARSLIGKWRQTYGNGVVLDVLAKCEIERPSDPVSWITATLEAEKRKAQGNGSANRTGSPLAQRGGGASQPRAGFERRAVEARSRQNPGAPYGPDDDEAGSDGELPLAAARVLPRG